MNSTRNYVSVYECNSMGRRMNSTWNFMETRMNSNTLKKVGNLY